jgi:hypothetical protein
LLFSREDREERRKIATTRTAVLHWMRIIADGRRYRTPGPIGRIFAALPFIATPSQLNHGEHGISGTIPLGERSTTKE